MARTKKPRKIGCHTEENMRAALELIEGGEKIRKAAKLRAIPYPTLRRYYLKIKHASEGEITRFVPNYSVNQIFSSEQEDTLIKYLKECAYIFYGLTNLDCRRLAYETAIMNKLDVPGSWKRDKIAGIEWLRSFRKRHPELALRTAESCSLGRASGFNRPNIKKYFKNLEDVLKRQPDFSNGTRVYNLDETSTTTVQKPPKVLAPKGIRCLSKVTSGEKGTLCTTCAIISASGQSLPPVVVFPRKNFKNYMIKGTPPGTLGLATPSGWMNSELFPEVIKHFIKHSSSSMANPSLLILDNHESHLSIESLELAKSNGITILTLPPHSSHKTQPLDVGVFKPFKCFYNATMDSWMMSHPGQPVTIYEVGAFIGEAYQKAMTPMTIANAFKKTGIFPFDQTVFTDIDFLPSTVTDRPQQDEIDLNSTAVDTSNTSKVANDATPDVLEKENTQSQENLSTVMDISQNTLQEAEKQQFIAPSDFRPPVKAQPRKNIRKNRKKGRSLIATDTPEKEEIFREKQAKKRRSEIEKRGKKGMKKTVRKVLQDSSTSESDSSMILESDDVMTDEDSDENNALNVEEELGKLARNPVEGEFIVVQFQGKKNLVYYIAKVLTIHNNDYEVSFLRKKSATQYIFSEPNVPDLATVLKWEVKLILPKPIEHGTTSRLQNSFYSFNVNFAGLSIR